MNKRIQELIEESYDLAEYNYAPPQKIFNKEKFAELLVQECIAQCNDGDSQWFIAQHFGVK
jgi:hypothetical protein